MWKTIARRFLILIPQLLILSLIIFIMATFMPGDALTGMIDPKVTGERLEELRQMYGFYDPWYVKYQRWVTGVLRGDLGQSMSYKMPTSTLIAERAEKTFWLALITTLLQYAIAIPLGIAAGRFHDKFADRAITLYTFVAMAVPTVIFALLNIYIFCFKLRIFPLSGSVDVTLTKGTFEYFLSRIHHLILPSITGALLYTTTIIHYLRSEIIDYEQSDFVVTAKSKGVPGRVIYSKHITRNAIIPVASFIGYGIAGLLGGSVFIENIFSYPGMGKLFIESITKRDMSVVNALVVMYAALTVLGTLLSDITLSIVDPRIRIK